MRAYLYITTAPRVSEAAKHTLNGVKVMTFCYEFTTGTKASVIAAAFEADKEHVFQHVSAAPFKRRHMLTWEELCELKRLCFRPEEECYQIFPKESEYVHGVNGMDNVMHIWRNLPPEEEGEARTWI